MSSLSDTLARVREAESVAAVAVLDSDGMVIASSSESSQDLEELAASAAGMLSFLGALGDEAGLGEPGQATVEFGDGTLFIGALEDSNLLLVIAEQGAPLGQVRLILRRYRDQLQQQLDSL